MSRLQRFRDAQRSPHSGFDDALEEIRAGRKRGHWIWYIFPQLAGLGMSASSQMFGIDGEEEAAEYLRDPRLRANLLVMANAVAGHLRAGRERSLTTLMSSELDARKLVSSLTLFGHVAAKLHRSDGDEDLGAFANVADEILAAAGSEGLPACAFTLERLKP